MTLIFLSYSSKDVSLAIDVERHLGSAGYDVWRDKRKIESDWSEEIAKNLASANVLILLGSKNASKSKYVKNEWLTARALHKVIKPVIVADSPELPEAISTLEAVLVKDSNSYLQRLIRGIKRLKTFDYPYDYKILPEYRYPIHSQSRL